MCFVLYSDELYGIRQIKFPILCEYDAKTSEIKILVVSEELSQLLCYIFSQFSQIEEKYKFWVLEHLIKMDYVQNCKKPAKPKSGSQNVLCCISCQF